MADPQSARDEAGDAQGNDAGRDRWPEWRAQAIATVTSGAARAATAPAAIPNTQRRDAQPPSPWRAQRQYLLGVALLALVLLLVGTVLNWWDNTAPGSGTGAGDLFLVLAPFLAIATAIERFWEVVFDWYESFALATARFVGVGRDTATWMREEAANAENAVKTLAEQLADKNPTHADYSRLSTAMRVAETRLTGAKTRIEEGLKAPEYVAVKRAITLLGSLVLGLVFSVSANLTLLSTAGFPVPVAADILLTGLLIGAGPGPLHSLIGILKELRNAAAGLAELARGAAIKRVADAAPAAAAAPRAIVADDFGGTMAAIAGPRAVTLAPEDAQRLLGGVGPRPGLVVAPGDLDAAETLRAQREARAALRFR